MNCDIDELKKELYKESNLDDNQCYQAVRMCVLHVFGKHQDTLEKYGLEICDYRALFAFLGKIYRCYCDKKVEVQKI